VKEEEGGRLGGSLSSIESVGDTVVPQSFFASTLYSINRYVELSTTCKKTVSL
jgi:hypothetical protein